eukprot:scaffold8836_cov89-Skeletonema_marinoi.AAC.3
MHSQGLSESPESRTGFVILAANCPISWKSTLQTKTALSTMEAEISALAHCMKELVGIMDLAKLFSEYYGLEEVKTKFNITIHEDNSGALVLANTIPPEYTSRSKFYHIETIWFREQIVTRGIEVVKIETTEQLGDIFTKGLTKEEINEWRIIPPHSAGVGDSTHALNKPLFSALYQESLFNY